MVQFTIELHTLNVACHSKSSINTNHRNFPTNELFTTEILHITNKINEFLLGVHFKLLAIKKKINEYNRLYLQMIVNLSGNIELNPGPVNGHEIEKENFDVFNN